MKSIKWRPVFFVMTCVCSLIFGFWSITQTASYKLWLKKLTWQKMDMMGVTVPRPLSSEIYYAIELLVAFALPVGLTWLVYFFIARYIFPPSKYRLKNISKKYLLEE